MLICPQTACKCSFDHHLFCCCISGVKLDNSSCEVLETVLSRVHTTSLDLEKANLEDEVRGRKGGREGGREG